MGTALHGYRSTDWAFCPGHSCHTRQISDFRHLDSYRCSHLGHDLPHDDESGFSERKTDWEESKGTSGHMGDELVDQAFHYVWNCLPVFVCRIQSVHTFGIGHTVSCGGSSFRSCSMYSDGVCVEYTYKREPCLYGCAGGHQ